MVEAPGFQPLVETALSKVHDELTTLEDIAVKIEPKFPPVMTSHA